MVENNILFADLQPAAMSPRSDSSGDCVVPQLRSSQLVQIPTSSSDHLQQSSFAAKADQEVMQSPARIGERISPDEVPRANKDQNLEMNSPQNGLKRASMMDALLEQVRAARRALKENDFEVSSQNELDNESQHSKLISESIRASNSPQSSDNSQEPLLISLDDKSVTDEVSRTNM